MSKIEEILQLPKEEQIAILEAIQDNLDAAEQKEITLNEDQVNYIKNRIQAVHSSNSPSYSWDEMKQKLNERWNSK